MGSPSHIILRDVRHGPPRSRLRLLVPLRYLQIQHPEKTMYDFIVPSLLGLAVWGVYSLLDPAPKMFGDDGAIRFARDFLIMAVPFMIGALASVAMGLPGPHLDKRAVGAPLYLDGRALTLRQFLCYLLGYLSFVGLVALIAVVVAGLVRPNFLLWTASNPAVYRLSHAAGTFGLAMVVSYLVIAVFWALYFLTDVANRPSQLESIEPTGDPSAPSAPVPRSARG